ncbi:MAG TPA: bifunctional glycosyltransferase family 2/GtrA family protein, partial [Candidatus Paceibacterota bacterium]
HEVIVVDDGSRDDTATLLHELAHEYDITILGDGTNHGKGAALRQGVLASRGDYILLTDADLSTPIDEIRKLLPRLMRDRYDVAIGSRAAVGSQKEQQPWYREVLSRSSNWLIRAVLGLPFLDTQCGFKLFRREAAVKLFKRLSLPRFSFDYEILLRAKRMHLRVAEVGVRWVHSPFTTVRGTDVVQCLVDVFRLRFAMEQSGEIKSLPGTEALRFIAVGLINTGVDAAIYIGLTRFSLVFADAPVTAKLFGFLAASVCSLFLNRYWTFGITSPLTFTETARFYLAASMGLVVNVSTMYVLVHGLHIYDLVSLAITTIVTFGVNYTLARSWVFKRTSEQSELAAYNI